MKPKEIRVTIELTIQLEPSISHAYYTIVEHSMILIKKTFLKILKILKISIFFDFFGGAV